MGWIGLVEPKKDSYYSFNDLQPPTVHSINSLPKLSSGNAQASTDANKEETG